MSDDDTRQAGEHSAAARLAACLTRWRLTPDGAVLRTPSSLLLPVRRGGVPAMLKLPLVAEERRGAAVMVWWDGDGAARVLAHDPAPDDGAGGGAVLLERLTGGRSLAAMARAGRDDEASRAVCAVAARLHAPRARPAPPTLVPLPRWFAALWTAADRPGEHGDVLRHAAAVARALLAEPHDVVVLHGDLHHDNVLDAGPRGWQAIDPKGLVGERGLDFANLFCNPGPDVAAAPGRLARQADVVAEAAGLDRARLVRWVLAYAGLSAAWSLEDGDDPAPALAVARLAAAGLASR